MTAQSFYRGGGSLIPRPHDVKVDPVTGLLRTTHGVSVFDCPDGLDRFGGAHRLEGLPENLRVIQRGRDPHHFEIVPAVPMTRDEYEEALRQINLVPV